MKLLFLLANKEYQAFDQLTEKYKVNFLKKIKEHYNKKREIEISWYSAIDYLVDMRYV